MTKTQLRMDIAARRKSMDVKWRAASSRQITERLQSLKIFTDARTIALYRAIAGEVDLEALFAACRELGKKTCIPVYNRDFKAYEMTEIKPDTRCHTGHYGIQEPLDPVPVPLEEIDLMVIPGVAFDRKGNRLGRGGGYYDRLLTGYTGDTVGVAFDFQILPVIPHDRHDLPVGCVISESRLIKV